MPLLVLVPLLTAVLVLVALLVPLLVLVALLTTLLNIARSSRAISRFATNFFILILWLMYFSADIYQSRVKISANKCLIWPYQDLANMFEYG